MWNAGLQKKRKAFIVGTKLFRLTNRKTCKDLFYVGLVYWTKTNMDVKKMDVIV